MLKSGSIFPEFGNALAHHHATRYNAEETYYNTQVVVIVGLLGSTAMHPSALGAGLVDVPEQDITIVLGNRTPGKYVTGAAAASGCWRMLSEGIETWGR
jgi:hypothetical protein